MNMTRVLILVAAIGAAGLAALLARSLLAGGQNKASASQGTEAAEVLVAAKPIAVGAKIMPGDLKWLGWPKGAIDPSFVTREAMPNALEESANGSVARTPLVTGEPVTAQKVIKSDGAGFMAAVLTPGMRAVGVKLTAERGAGGFILPNDRVDVIMTRKLGNDDSGVTAYRAMTVLRDVRVLAVDQTSQEEGDSKAIVGKTATLEMTAKQAEVISLAEAMGDLTLSLRSLSQSDAPDAPDDLSKGFGADDANQIAVFRYGIPAHAAAANQD